MKKIRGLNFICYVLITYLLSSLYGILFRWEVPRILKFENLNNLSILFLVLLITGYLVTNFFKSLKEIFKSGVKKLCYISAIIYGININNVALIYAISMCLIAVYVVLFLENRQIKKQKKVDESEKEPELYPSRRNLMEVLNHALGEYSLIALDGTWGSGKTTFMDIVMRDNREKYYYIPVNVMLFENRNSLKTEFLNQLKGIFKEEGIFQGSLMDFDYYLDGVSNDWIKIVKNIIFSKSKSFKEANEKLKSEIEKIEKKIVVGVDNLERIYGESEPEWKQILGFIHELQELGIKIVVMANLEEMLTTKKETGEKDLSTHEYFDKFYEFKLKLNEVTTEEIIDQVENVSVDDKIWMKEQILELKLNLLKYSTNIEYSQLESKKAGLRGKRSALAYNQNTDDEKWKKLKEEEKELDEAMKKEMKNTNERQEMLERYHNGIKNPRRIEKLMKDIQLKKEKIANIFKSFIDDDEYKNLILRTSVFTLFYFDQLIKFSEYQIKEESDIFIVNAFLYERKDLGVDRLERAVNRLLYYRVEDDNIKKRLENLDRDKINTVSEVEKLLEDLNAYDGKLDPDLNKGTTKKVYEIIESKLIELEETDELKIHEILEKYKKLILKIVYLSNFKDIKIFEKTKFKFNIIDILLQYKSKIRTLEHVVYGERESLFEVGLGEIELDLKKIRKIIIDFCNSKTSSTFLKMEECYENQSKFTIEDIDELKKKIEEREKYLFFKNGLEIREDYVFDKINNLLNILKIELNKKGIKGSEQLKERVKRMRKSERKKILEKIKFEQSYTKNADLINIIFETEDDPKTKLDMYYIITIANNRKFNHEIEEKLQKVWNEEDKKEFIKFINEKLENDKILYVYGDLGKDRIDRGHTIDKLKDKGITKGNNEFILENEGLSKKVCK